MGSGTKKSGEKAGSARLVASGGCAAADAPRGGGEPVFCEGCGARLRPQDRTCPKCGRPAPGILSVRASSSDLAAGRTASFPRLTPGMVEDGQAGPSAPELIARSLDPEATSVMDSRAIEARFPGHGRAAGGPSPCPTGGHAPGPDAYARPRNGRRIAAALAALAVVGGVAYFVAADPLGVMPGIYRSAREQAREMFPSRTGAAATTKGGGGDGAADGGSASDGSSPDGGAEVSDQALSNSAAYAKLISIWGTIKDFQDELEPVVSDYNGYYIAADRSKREAASKSAYSMRDRVRTVVDELGSIKLSDGSPYEDDVANLKQLAVWMYNRVDVLCRSWDISLGLADGETPASHRAEITAPLTDAIGSDGSNSDVTQYETHLYEWKPVEEP